MNFGKQRELEHIDPFQIKLNDDKVEGSIFRNARTTLKQQEMATNRESIRKLGLLKPLMVRPLKNDPDGYLYQLICGSRRLRNILRLVNESKAIASEGRDFSESELCYCPETAEWRPAYEVYATVKTFVRECDDDTAIRINIAENLEHSKLPEIDLMEYCQELVDLKKVDGRTHLYKREEVADMCNRSESWVSLTLELNQLPESIKQMMYDDRVTRTGALAFLQTEKDKIHEVIALSEQIVREEKLTEAKIIEQGEIVTAQVELEDALNDVEIHDMMENSNLREMANKRAGQCRKRVSAASEKRDTILKEAESPKLTADIINRANLMVPNAKKGSTAAKAMPVKSIKEMNAGFKDLLSKSPTKCNRMVLDTVQGVFDVILGHRAPVSVETLIDQLNEQYEFEKKQIQEEVVA
jgi:ParB-like chromosome segregation protein Spo0J